MGRSPNITVLTRPVPVSPQMGALYGSAYIGGGQMGGSLAQYQAAAANPSVRAFLDTVAWAEGADYNTLFGGNTFSSYAQHPLAIGAIRLANGSTTSAAGRYQFERGTWDGAQRALGLSDFSPANQDLAAIYLIDGRGQLNKLMAGDIDGTLRGLGCLWASLPFSGCGQGQRDYDAVIRYYNGALAVYSSGAAPLASTAASGGTSSGITTLALLVGLYFLLS